MTTAPVPPRRSRDRAPAAGRGKQQQQQQQQLQQQQPQPQRQEAGAQLSDDVHRRYKETLEYVFALKQVRFCLWAAWPSFASWRWRRPLAATWQPLGPWHIPAFAALLGGRGALLPFLQFWQRGQGSPCVCCIRPCTAAPALLSCSPCLAWPRSANDPLPTLAMPRSATHFPA